MQSVAEEQVTAMKADLKTATAALTDARSKLVAARAAAETAKKSAGAAEANKQLQKNLAAENKQLRDLHEAELNRVKKAQRQALATLTDQNQKLQESYDEQVKQMTDGHQQIADELESQTQQLRKAHEAEIAQLSEARNQTAAELTAKIAEYDDMKLNTTASSAANGNLSAEKEMLTKRAKRLGAEKEELRKALDVHTADTAALATTLAERDDELARARAELMRSRQELQETKSTHSRSIRDVEEKVMADRTNEVRASSEYSSAWQRGVGHDTGWSEKRYDCSILPDLPTALFSLPPFAFVFFASSSQTSSSKWYRRWIQK